MTATPFLVNAGALALSLFNTILLVWLGLTVLFNAERRAWGMFLAVVGLLTGGIFFLSHSIILSQGASSLVRDFRFWWHVGWLPLVAAPFAWYLLMLWYSGFWDAPPNPLRRRQAFWFYLSIAFTLVLGGLLLMANPLPSIEWGAYVQVERLPSLGSLPLILLAYPPYILLCIGLALDALLRPVPSGRIMGDLARRRARPWLAGTSFVLLLVSLLVGGIFIWLIQVARSTPAVSDLMGAHAVTLSTLDLLLTAMLSGAVLLIGQAVVSYEIFTGKTLPRRGFHKQWRNLVLLAGGLSLIAGFGSTAAVPAIYLILAILLLASFSFALFSWQSYADREQSIRQLRPFAASQRLFDSILTPALPPDGFDFSTPFRSLCQEVLAADRAALVPLGALAGLGIPALHHPAGPSGALPPLAGLLERFPSPQVIGLPLDPDGHGGYLWAAPLWSERGLTGLLLLGEKRDGGFYSLEEIEIARAGGERLVDLLASAEMARRLIALQRQRLVESGILDRRTRRVLHDDVLPRLHTALLQINTLPADGHELPDLLASAHRQISDLLRELPRLAAPELARRSLAGALRQLVEQELQGSFDRVNFRIDPQADQRSRQLPDLVVEVLYFAAREAVRNAARHARTGKDSGDLVLDVQLDWRDGLWLSIQDNGGGVQPSGRISDGGGQGLSLHSTMMAVINGSLALESVPGEYTRLTLHLPESALALWDTPSEPA